MECNINCCFLLNTMCVYFSGTNDEIYTVPCCLWRNHKDEIHDLVNTKIDDLSMFFEKFKEIRSFVFNNQKKICTKCVIKNTHYLPFKFSPDFLQIGIGHICNLNCPYCFRTKGLHETLPESYIKNKDAWEKVIADPRIKTIEICGNGEFFANKEVMDLCLDWKTKYGKKLSVVTNFTLYDPNYPMDFLNLSWHKAADKDVFISNLDKIPFHISDITVFMMVGNPEYAFSLEEAYELATKYLQPFRHNVVYVDIFCSNVGKGECYSGNYSESEFNSIVVKTRLKGFVRSSHRMYNSNNYKGSTNA